MSEIDVLSSTALKPTLDEALPEFERASGHTAKVTFAPSAQITKRMADGAASDVLLVTGTDFAELLGLGKVLADSRKDLASSIIGLAVREGAVKPDISTPDRFRSVMLAAKSIATSNPDGGGASGPHLADVFRRLGIADAIRPKLTYGPGGPKGLIGNFVKSGQTELGLQQIPELLSVPGIELVGPLPEELQMVTLYSACLSSTALHADAGKALIAFLASSTVAAVLRAKGMDPAQ
jgi:molybdate transport system substrate-binding protein